LVAEQDLAYVCDKGYAGRTNNIYLPFK
jgi:hypothetical protein